MDKKKVQLTLLNAMNDAADKLDGIEALPFGFRTKGEVI